MSVCISGLIAVRVIDPISYCQSRCGEQRGSEPMSKGGKVDTPDRGFGLGDFLQCFVAQNRHQFNHSVLHNEPQPTILGRLESCVSGAYMIEEALVRIKLEDRNR